MTVGKRRLVSLPYVTVSYRMVTYRTLRVARPSAKIEPGFSQNMTRFIPKIVSIKGCRRNFFSSPLHFPRLAPLQRFQSPPSQNIATMDPHSQIGAAVNHLAPGYLCLGLPEALLDNIC